MKSLRLAIFVVCFLLLTGFLQQAVAITVRPISGSTSAPIAYSSSVNNVIDGIVNVSSYLALGNDGMGTWNGPYTVTFDLGAEYDLTSFNLWNNAGVGNDGEGVNSFSLKFFDSNLNEVGTLFEDSATDAMNEQNFAIGVNNVKLVDFTINNAHSTGTGYWHTSPDGRTDTWISTERQYVMFHETDFDGTPSVPVPATMLLFGSGLVGLVGSRMRKKKK